MRRSNTRFERDLRHGYQLRLVRQYTARVGFQGAAKGQGFSAWLKAHNIPHRRAYRLIARWERMKKLVEGMNECYRKFESSLVEEFFEGSRVERNFDELIELMKSSKPIRDSVSDTKGDAHEQS